jgi:hypothetical protein
MPVKKVPQKFETSDGEEFDNEGDAKRHQDVVDAILAFNEAKKNLAFATVREYKTADGKPFQFSSSTAYYFIRDAWGWPRMDKVEVCGWYNQKFDVDNQRLRVVVGEGNQRCVYSVTELYQDEAAARRALIAAMESKMEEYAKAIADEKAKLKNGV